MSVGENQFVLDAWKFSNVGRIKGSRSSERDDQRSFSFPLYSNTRR